MIVLDTNVFIDLLRNYAPAADFFQSLDPEKVLFSAITESELVAGKENEHPEKREKLLHFLHVWRKIPLTNPVASLAGDISRRNGLAIPDAIIAATAILNHAELVTRNMKDFKAVPGLKLRSPY
jgi:tRNA(fMet)-specific endonuclease VapC